MEAKSRSAYGIAGVIAGVVGIGVSLGVAWLTDAVTNPVVAVASEVRDRTPGHLAINLVHLVGHADKPLLVGGTTVILLALCWLAGAMSRRSSVLGMAIVLCLGVLGTLAVVDQPHAGLSGVASAVCGLLAWLLVHRALTDTAHDFEESRRTFVVGATASLVATGVVMLGGRLLGHGRAAVEAARSRLKLNLARGAEPATADLGVDGIASWRTPAGSFYRVAAEIVPPAIEPSQWSLRIHGMVDRELTFTYDDIVARAKQGGWLTLCCVSNEVGGDLVGNAYWTGVLARSLLAEAGVQAGADAVKQTSYDGWTCGTPIEALTDDRLALIAIGMNGEPLPIDHGFPVRMVVPGLYGYVSATKWLVDLEVTTFDRFTAYWTERGWAEKGPVKTESRIDVPRSGRSLPSGAVAVGGVAWAQHTGIEKVEFQVDGGPWQKARLGGVPDNDTWVQWAGNVNVDRGSHEVRVRATDKSGYTQTGVRRGLLPDGATGWHTVRFTAT
jgi:DMSO/TMAO reductase YedYZ molybdopterin-dependent catalytic subunit